MCPSKGEVTEVQELVQIQLLEGKAQRLAQRSEIERGVILLLGHAIGTVNSSDCRLIYLFVLTKIPFTKISFHYVKIYNENQED